MTNELNREEIRERILIRIPAQFGKWLSCDEGWYHIIDELDQQLAHLDPNYVIHQVKEKFGTLRFYFGTEQTAPVSNIMHKLATLAEIRSEQTCETCGNSKGGSRPGISKWDSTVTLHNNHGLYKTLCSTCAEKQQFVPATRDTDAEILKLIKRYAAEANRGDKTIETLVKIAEEDLDD